MSSPTPPRRRGGASATSRPAALIRSQPYAAADPARTLANELTHALITARAGGDRLLFLVPAQGWEARPGTWQAIGMAGSDSPTVDVAATLQDDALVGPPGAYLARPGFWHGGIGVAAVWHGGAVGVAAALGATVASRPLSPHAAAHLGGVEVAATETLDRVGRALGAGPLCHDRAHARRVTDLTVYLRQSHVESDLEALGRMVAGA